MRGEKFFGLNERGIVASMAIGIATAVSTALGGGLLAGGIGAITAAGVIGGAGVGIAMGLNAIFNPKTGKMEEPKKMEAPKYEDAQAKAKEDMKRRRLQIADAGGTNLTSPMGLSAKAPVQQKTVLGQ